MHLSPAYTVEHCWKTPTRCFKSRITDLTTQPSYYASLLHSSSHPLKWLSETFSLLKYPLPFLSLLHFHVTILSHTPLRNQKLHRNSLSFLPPSLITYIHLYPYPLQSLTVSQWLECPWQKLDSLGLCFEELPKFPPLVLTTRTWTSNLLFHLIVQLRCLTDIPPMQPLPSTCTCHAVHLSPELTNADWPTSILIPL